MNSENYLDIIKKLALQIKNEPAKYLFDKFISEKNFNSNIRRRLGDLFFESIRYYRRLVEDPDFNLEQVKNEVCSKDLTLQDLTDIFGLNDEIAEYVNESLNDLNDYKFLLSRGPLTLRVNPMKMTRDRLLSFLNDFKPIKTEISPFGIKLNSNINVRQLQEFKKGFFEIQDEASQLVFNLVAPKPNEKILDLCAGTGGKSILLQSCSFNTLDLHSYDISKSRLAVLQKRAKILGLKVKIVEKPSLHYYDKVLIDAPCSGSGVIRRDVDNLLRMDKDRLLELVKTQRMLLNKAINFVRKGGVIIYFTCSFLRKENEENIEYILNEYRNLRLVEVCDILDANIVEKLNLKSYFKTYTKYYGMDGFFGAVLRVD
ncbi:RsmB/NOP family class I SAM-dependent RNA methyltransferase [Calditerrivibrio nitroreducens]|uniref:Fmu (Sun) domain protein n=1 Tax=Calditerrivibrio nitroreducens (strain DSM 19672 / NBRC 101217 / Yu37-1) TaxID=768670 RepID=E4THF2_CALNY|nr:RsmB/NOP family class I SAM-dependent RNA methyltransferase [Calditerrivibrio nitroreducens]ADR19887.1 Fmu (Sun) domain protein [Calditerrivibrio nitroreducens DSM 19672]